MRAQVGPDIGVRQRHPYRVVPWIGVVLATAYLISFAVFPKPGGRIIAGDAAGHFVQLRSLVYDHDLDFRNENTRIRAYDNLREPPPDWHLTSTGLVGNFMPIGPALLWAPGYLLTSGILRAAAAAGWASPPDGFDRPLQIVPGLTGIAAATFAAWLACGMAARIAGRERALAGVLGVWLGSPAVYYSLVSPAYSHAASMLACTLLVWHWLRTRDHWTWQRAAASGALAGCAALMRWQDAVMLAIPVIECLRCPTSVWRRLGLAAIAGAACLAVFSPQMAVWQVLYGSPLTVPQGPSFMMWFRPHLLDVLVANKHGLFTWSPVLVPAVWGLGMLMNRKRALAAPIIVVAVATWYVNAAVADWWAGEAFGARRFLSLFPFLAMGLVTWLQPHAAARARSRVWIVTALVCANVLLLLQYQLCLKGLHDVAPYPDESWVSMWLVRFVVPFRLIARWWS